MVPQWVKVLVGSLALMMGASAPSLVVEGLRWHHHRPKIDRATEQNTSRPTNKQEQPARPQRESEQTVPGNTEIIAPNEKLESGNQKNRGEEESGESYFVISSYRVKPTDFAVAVFTALLVWVGYSQAIRLGQTLRIAKQSADTLPSLERAYVFMEINPWSVPNITRLLRPEEVLDLVVNRSNEPTIEFQFVNHGKTPAIIKARSARLEHLTTLPVELVYIDEPLEDVSVIASGAIYPGVSAITAGGVQTIDEGRLLRYRLRATLGRVLDDAEIQSLTTGQSFLWFYGHVVYDDVFGREHETRFCWCYNGLAHSFQQYGKEQNART